MEKAKQQPGPWSRLRKAASEAMDKLQAEFCNLGTDVWGDDDAMQVYADLHRAAEDVDKAKLNADSLPDLLAALEDLLAAREQGQLTAAEWEAARAAIAKAQGE